MTGKREQRDGDGGEPESPVAMYGFLFNMSRRHGYLSSTLLACRAVAQPHPQLEICINSVE